MAAPNGLFAQALTARSRSVLLWSLPFWGLFLLAAIAAIDPQADFEAVIAPVKAAKGLGDQLAARADRAGPGEG